MQRMESRTILRCLTCLSPLMLVCALAAFASAQDPASPSVARRSPGAAAKSESEQPPRGFGDGMRRLPGGPNGPTQTTRQAQATQRGLLLNTDAACGGYTLFTPLNSTKTYLVDLQGKLAHTWPSRYEPGQSVYLLEDGSILRAGREPENRHFGGGGIGGRVERIAPDGKVLWEYVCADEHRCQHHDIKPMPNGHVLIIAWEKRTREQAVAAGRDPQAMGGDEMWPDCVLEVAPRGSSGGRIVWEWHVWDHLVQDVDAGKPNYGVVAEHPERVDVNYRRTAPRETPAELRRLRSLGYIGGRASEEEEEDEDEQEEEGKNENEGGEDGEEDREREEGKEGEGSKDENRNNKPPMFRPAGPFGFGGQPDWCHTNSIDYNEKLDQIVLGVHTFNEVWVIDHSTTTKEAAGHRGGRCGMGGDLLYRWGNPRAYGAGGAKDQMLFAQHDVRWIPDGSPGAGHLTIFNNGMGRTGGRYSSVVEIEPPIDSSGRYRKEPGKAFGPAQPSWEYTAADKSEFFSGHISGAERLPNGNTLICSGEQGRIFEVNASGKTVWEYINPYDEREGRPRGFGLGGRGRGPDGWRVPERRHRDASNATSRPASRDDAALDGEIASAGRPGEGNRPERPDGRRSWGRPPPGGTPWGPPGGAMGFPPGPGGPGGGPGGPGGGPGGGLFRATRLASDHPGVRHVLHARVADGDSEH